MRSPKTILASVPTPAAGEPRPPHTACRAAARWCCIGDERLSYEERTFSYCPVAVMNDHFDRQHLKELEQLEHENLVFCEHPKGKKEGVKLVHLDHFRNHWGTVHGQNC